MWAGHLAGSGDLAVHHRNELVEGETPANRETHLLVRQSIETAVPEMPLVCKPAVNCVERIRRELVGTNSPDFGGGNDSGAFEKLKVLQE